MQPLDIFVQLLFVLLDALVVHFVEVTLLEQLIVGGFGLLGQEQGLIELPLQLFDLILQHFVFDLGVGDVLLGLDALVPFFLSDAGGTWKELSVLVMLLRMRKFLM